MKTYTKNKLYEGTKEEISAAMIADGLSDPFAPSTVNPRASAKAKFNELPDAVRIPFLPAWVMINQLLDISGSSDAVKYFDMLQIPYGYEEQAEQIREDLLLI